MFVYNHTNNAVSIRINDRFRNYSMTLFFVLKKEKRKEGGKGHFFSCRSLVLYDVLFLFLKPDDYSSYRCTIGRCDVQIKKIYFPYLFLYTIDMPGVNKYAIGIILSLQTITHCVITTVGQYIYSSYLQIYPYGANTTVNWTNISLYNLTDSTDWVTIEDDAQLWAQEQTANLFFRIDLWNSCPLVIMTYLLGVYTPKIGRQTVLILPMIGTSIQFIIWLAIIYFQLADYWWYIASFIVGLSGSSYISNFILSLIITDTTKEDSRSTNFVVFEAITTAVSALATFGIGYYIDWRGFTDLYWISLGLQLISIVIVIVYFKNSSFIIDERTSLLSSSSTTETSPSSKTCNNCCISIFNFHTSYERRKSISILLTLVSYIFYLLAYSTYASFLWFLLNDPFNWSSENIGNYTALSSISSAIFSLLGMKLFTRIGMNDIMICTLSHFCFTLSSLWIAFSRYSWQLYAGLLISPYADYQNSLTFPMLSKWLKVHERNHAFTLVTEINTIITTFGDSIFNWIYSKTVSKSRNFLLLLAAGLSTISFLLNM